jgi:hypothetical protein
MPLKHPFTLFTASLLIALPGFYQAAPTPPKESAPARVEPRASCEATTAPSLLLTRSTAKGPNYDE